MYIWRPLGMHVDLLHDIASRYRKAFYNRIARRHFQARRKKLFLFK